MKKKNKKYGKGFLPPSELNFDGIFDINKEPNIRDCYYFVLSNSRELDNEGVYGYNGFIRIYYGFISDRKNI
jgi:hypothetical protein